MRNKFSRVVAVFLALFLVLGNFGATTAYAADNATGEKVLTVTPDMTGENGILTVSGTWDRIIVPKEIDASTIRFKEVQAGSVEIESGLSGKIELVSGSIGALTVLPAKLTTMTVTDVINMIKETNDTQAAIDLYFETRNKSDEYLSKRPTIVAKNDMEISDVTISGNVKLNLSNGKVDNVKVDADGSQSVLDVTISNFNGNVTVKQTGNEDGNYSLSRIKFKNSAIDTLVMDGDGNGNVVLEGQKTNVGEVQVENSSSVSLNLPTETVTVSETATNVDLTVLNKVDEMKVSAAETRIEVGNCGTVTNATVEGENVTVSGNGVLTDVEITGENVAVSTPGTKVEGENAYVPPVITTKPSGGAAPGERDLGGLELVIVDSWSDYYTPDSPEYAAQQAYREEMMQKHNFTVRRVQMGDYYDLGNLLETAYALGSPIGHIFQFDSLGASQAALRDRTHLFYNLATLSEFDFTDDKWNPAVKELMSYKNGIYGMTPRIDFDASTDTEIYGVFYNKNLFEAAGLDPNLPYTLQANGEWTWSKFKEISKQLTRDINEDGVTDIYAMCNNPESMMSQLLHSVGGELIGVQNGRFVNNYASNEVLSVLNYVKELYDAGYATKTVDEEYNWIDQTVVFQTEVAAMQFAPTSRLNDHWEMTSDIGFVCCPKPDGASSYQIKAEPSSVAVIPAFYDAKTASDIAFAYNLWTNPAPEYAEVGDTWKYFHYHWGLDEKAIDETISLYYEEDLGVASHTLLSDAWEYGTYQDFQSALEEGYTPSEILQRSYMIEEYDGYVTALNTASAPRVTFNPTPYTLPYTLRLNSDGTLTVTGCTDRELENVIIPNSIIGKMVTKIAYEAFAYSDRIKTVTLPAGLREIDDFAFAACFMLDDIIIPDGVTTIGNSAFQECAFLDNVTIPKSVTRIGERAFDWCSEDLTLTVEANSPAEFYALANNINIAYANAPEGGTTEVRDLGGMNIVIGDYFSYNWTDDYYTYPSSMEPYANALRTYRNAMMKKHNFTITQNAITYPNDMDEKLKADVESGVPDAQVYVLPLYEFLQDLDLFYDLSTLSEFNFDEDKWCDATKELMSYHGGLYGMSPVTGMDSWINGGRLQYMHGIVFNKRILAEAGIDSEYLYDLQASGQWTWEKFEEICGLLTRDIDNDGETDIYALASKSNDFLEQLIISTGEQLVEVDANGNFVNNVTSDKVREALDFATKLYNAGHILPQKPEDNWNHFETAFQNGTVAMQFTAGGVTDGGNPYNEMEDELGFVCCPKPDGAQSYRMVMTPMVVVIPSCYDAETASDIAFAYNLWTNQAPGYEGFQQNNSTFDDRALNETAALYYEDGVAVLPYEYLITNEDELNIDLFFSYPFNGNPTLDELLDVMDTKWDELVENANN